MELDFYIATGCIILAFSLYTSIMLGNLKVIRARNAARRAARLKKPQ